MGKLTHKGVQGPSDAIQVIWRPSRQGDETTGPIVYVLTVGRWTWRDRKHTKDRVAAKHPELDDKTCNRAAKLIEGQIRYALVMIEHMSRWFDENHQGAPVCRDATRVVDFRSITLEHIEASNAANLDPELTPYINNLGNLTVMSQAENDAVANKPFEQKRAIFSQSDLSINRLIGEYETWNLENFKARQQNLLDRCMAIFSI